MSESVTLSLSKRLKHIKSALRQATIDVILQMIINQNFNKFRISIQLGHSTVSPFYLNPA